MAKYIELNSHTYSCNKRKKGFIGNYCELNPEIFVLVLCGEFIVLKTPSCNIYGSMIDYIEPMINNVIESKSIELDFKIGSINRAILDRDLRELRIRGVELNKYYEEVNFCYSNVTTNYYLISEMELNYSKVSIYNDKLNKSYLEIKEKIKGTQNEKYILNSIDELFEINLINDWSTDLERVKTVDILIKKLKKNATSKH